MAKQGWGFSGNTVKLNTNNRVEKKLNIWETAGKADDIQYIPDAEEEKKPQNQISDAGVVLGYSQKSYFIWVFILDYICSLCLYNIFNQFNRELMKSFKSFIVDCKSYRILMNCRTQLKYHPCLNQYLQQRIQIQADDIDFSILTQVLRPAEEVQETDEQWEFSKLKTEMQEIVNKLYSNKTNS